MVDVQNDPFEDARREAEAKYGKDPSGGFEPGGITGFAPMHSGALRAPLAAYEGDPLDGPKPLSALVSELETKYESAPQKLASIKRSLETIKESLSHLALQGHFFDLVEAAAKPIQEWPKMFYHEDGRSIVLHSQEAANGLSEGWHGHPAKAAEGRANRPEPINALPEHPPVDPAPVPKVALAPKADVRLSVGPDGRPMLTDSWGQPKVSEYEAPLAERPIDPEEI